MRNLLNRFKEPSTWAGVGILASMFGVSEPVYTAVTAAIAAVAGAVAILLPEKKSA